MDKNQYEINNNLKDSFISISVESDSLIEYQYRIMNKFSIPHILKLSGVYNHQDLLHYYQINDMDSIAYCFKEHTFGYAIIEKLVRNLLDVITSCHDYMLDEDRLDLRPEFIYYHRLEKVFYFLYRPTLEFTQSVKSQTFNLFDYLIKEVNPADYKGINLTHRLRIAIENERLNSDEIEGILNDIEINKVNGKDFDMRDMNYHIRVKPQARKHIEKRPSVFERLGLKLFGKEQESEANESKYAK